jgi:hypothetical protein
MRDQEYAEISIEIDGWLWNPAEGDAGGGAIAQSVVLAAAAVAEVEQSSTPEREAANPSWLAL